MSKLELFLSYKFLTSKFSDKFILITRRLAFFGISIGVATLIIVTSVMNGFKYEFMKNLTGLNGEVVIKSRSGKISDYKELLDKLKTVNYIKAAIPSINEQSLILVNGKYTGTIALGLSQENIRKHQQIKITQGQINEDTIGIGDVFLHNVHACIGDKIKIISPSPKSTGFGQVPRAKTFTIGFSFTTGLYNYDSHLIIMPIRQAQLLFEYQDTVSDVQIFFQKPELLANFSRDASSLFEDPNLYTLDWQNSNKAFMNAINIERNVMTLILALITLVAAFNVVSCMVMLVRDKAKDIAILKTFGMPKSSIIKIFMFCGSVIGILGTLCGLFFGVIVSVNLDKIKCFLEQFTDCKLFSGEIYFLLELPCKVEPSEILYITAFSIIISVLTTVYPALKAGKQNPVNILRYE